MLQSRAVTFNRLCTSAQIQNSVFLRILVVARRKTNKQTYLKETGINEPCGSKIKGDREALAPGKAGRSSPVMPCRSRFLFLTSLPCTESQDSCRYLPVSHEFLFIFFREERRCVSLGKKITRFFQI